jgi:hypothetical protein
MGDGVVSRSIEYLSPVFDFSSPYEREVLRSLHGGTGVSLFWLDIVRPLAELCGARHVLEIGAFRGDHSKHLLGYCESVDGHLTIVEPCPAGGLRQMVEGSKRARLIEAFSDQVADEVELPVDLVVLEGDLNYHTVLRDLKMVQAWGSRQNRGFPVVFVCATSWPYARRDMYYHPSRVPLDACCPNMKAGFSPWSRELEPGLINSDYWNAVDEGGPRNGVLTAVEDFLDGTGLAHFAIPSNHGLTVVYSVASGVGDWIDANLRPPPSLARLLQTMEIARINSIVHRLEMGRERRAAEPWLARILRGLGRRLLRTVGA